MSQLFEPFRSELSRQQLSLLLDTVLYFEEAPKFLSLPHAKENHIAVPLLPDTLRQMIDAVPEQDRFAKQSFQFSWQAEEENKGELVVNLPNGQQILQKTDLSRFSPV